MLFRNLKAHVSFSVLAAFSICLIGTGAQAQDVPTFTPVSAWEVNKTDLSNVRGLSSMKLPCVITTEFDNGFVMRLSGGGGNLLAMAVDFRQSVFQKGKKYAAMVAVGDSYVKQASASAFNENTLIFNLRPLDGFYNTVKSGSDIEIGLDANNLKFAVGDLSKALTDLEGCYAGTKTAPVPMTETLRSASVDSGKIAAPMPIAPPVAVEAEELPRTFDEIINEGKSDVGMSPMPGGENVKVAAQVSPRIAARSSAKTLENVNTRANTVSRGVTVPATLPPIAEPRMAAASSPVVAPKSWEAKAGEDMKIVLSRWAERADYDLQWQAENDGKVAQDMMLNGSFEEAVGQLLAENSAASGISGHVETTTGQTQKIAAKTANAAPAPMPTSTTKAIIPAYHDEWTAPAGANIQTILDQWASKAGVAIVWQSYMSVPVKNPISVNGSFEQAVQSLLDQYNSDANRPVAQLNIDPDTGQRTLLMNLDKSV